MKDDNPPVEAKLHGHRVSTKTARRLGDGYISIPVALYWERGVYFLVTEDPLGRKQIIRLSETEARELQKRLI